MLVRGGDGEGRKTGDAVEQGSAEGDREGSGRSGAEESTCFCSSGSEEEEGEEDFVRAEEETGQEAREAGTGRGAQSTDRTTAAVQTQGRGEEAVPAAVYGQTAQVVDRCCVAILPGILYFE